MVSVTQRITQIKQPRGGYLPISKFEAIQLEDGRTLGEDSVSGATIGMVVDYLSRWEFSGNKEDSFRISMRGAVRANRENEAKKLFDGIWDMTDPSIVNACKLVGFDSYARGVFIDYDPSTVNADRETCQNIRIMVDRVREFHRRFGVATLEGFNFMGGYSRVVDRGDGDFLTEDTLWDLKVMKKDPEAKHTLQLLMYYIMGKRSIHEEFRSVTKIGFFNPRLNKVHVIKADSIDPAIIKTVEDEVICYTGNEAGIGNQLVLELQSMIPGNSPSDYPAFDQKLLSIYFSKDPDKELLVDGYLARDPKNVTALFLKSYYVLAHDGNAMSYIVDALSNVNDSDLEQLFDLYKHLFNRIIAAICSSGFFTSVVCLNIITFDATLHSPDRDYHRYMSNEILEDLLSSESNVEHPQALIEIIVKLLDMSLLYNVSLKRHVDLISKVYDYCIRVANRARPVPLANHLVPIPALIRFTKALLDCSKSSADKVVRSGRPLDKVFLTYEYPGFFFDFQAATEAKLFSERKISKVFKDMENYYSGFNES